MAVHLIALVDSPDHVCCRYRLRAFEPHFVRAGHSLELRSLPKNFWDRIHMGSSLQNADAVIVQRKLLSTWQVWALRRRVKRLIFDIDDAVWLRDSYAKRGHISFRRMNRFRAIARVCDAVIAGNSFLAEAANTWAITPCVEVIPTCVDESAYPVANHQRVGNDAQLVWIGSSSTLRGLELTRPLLEEIGQSIPGLNFKIICDRFPSFDHLRIIECPWTPERETAELAAADIGLSWVPDDPWSRGKCGLKVLQYMAAGLPVVANPVGVQAEMVRHGETGFLATTPGEWIKAVRTLAFDPVLRQRMGEAGRAVLEAEFSVRAGAERWMRLLNSFRNQRMIA